MMIKLSRYAMIPLLAACAACLCGPQASLSQGLLKPSDAKQLERSAQTAAEFDQLAVYFDLRSSDFAQRAQAEDWELFRLQNVTFRAKNYPILVDRAVNSGKYDRSEAQKYADKAAAFHLRALAAEGQSPTSGKLYE